MLTAEEKDELLGSVRDIKKRQNEMYGELRTMTKAFPKNDLGDPDFDGHRKDHIHRREYDTVLDEYKVDAIFEPADIHTARWLTFPDDVTRRNFEREQALRLGKDIDGNPVYLATSRYNLEVTAEKWPKVTFHATREHGEVLG